MGPWLESEIEISTSFDDLFDAGPIGSIIPNLVEDLLERERHGPVTYVVPGFGHIADATIAALAARTTVSVIPGSISSQPLPAGSVQIIDALDLAIAESESPFDAGLARLDPGMPAIVTNFYGDAVIGPAASRLHRIYGDFVIEPDADRSLSFEAIDPLSDHNPSMSALLHVISRLRRDDGCPWDREQTPRTLLPMLQEEIAELATAIERGDIANQMEEIGDVLMHLVMLAQIAHESGQFEIGDVIDSIRAKMVRRHPHVFAGKRIDTLDELYETWEQIKVQEKAESAGKTSQKPGGTA